MSPESTPPTAAAPSSDRPTFHDTMDPTTVLYFAMVAGVATGLIEATIWAVRRYLMHRMIYQGDHFFWLAPLTDLILFVVIGVGLAVAVRILPRLFRPRLVAWIILFVSALGLRGIAPRVHLIAWLVLSAGVATALSEFIKVRTDRGMLRVRRLALSSVVLCAVLATLGLVGEGRRERQAIADLPEASSEAPNLLWIVLDTVPAKRMSMYGYDQATTPRLEQIGKDGVVFNRCISPSSWTLPSHGSMFTGIMPQDQTSNWTVPMDNSHQTIAEFLQEQGYASAGFVANPWYLSAEFGLGRGFGRFREPRTMLMQAIKSSQLASSIGNRTFLPVFRGQLVGQRNAEDINRECLDWIEKHSQDRPYFAFLNYIDAHGPYLPPPEFSQKFGFPKPLNLFPNNYILRRPNADEQLREQTAAYDACLAYLDDQIGQLIDELRSRGHLDNTVVIITSDHGEHLGENNLMGHGNSLYLPLIHVPLMILYPQRLPPGTVVDEVVNLNDMPATVTDLLGLSSKSPFSGLTLVQRVEQIDTRQNTAGNETDVGAVMQVSPKPKDRMELGEQFSPIAKGQIRAALNGRYHYILNGDGSEELYRYVDDPEETKNLISEDADQDDANQDDADRDELQRLRDAVAF